MFNFDRKSHFSRFKTNKFYSMEEIKDLSNDLDHLSDIELVVIVAKRIDRCIDLYFSPPHIPKRSMLGKKLSMSTLDKRLKKE